MGLRRAAKREAGISYMYNFRHVFDNMCITGPNSPPAYLLFMLSPFALHTHSVGTWAWLDYRVTTCSGGGWFCSGFY
jgi:hypothetical protein